MIQALMRSLLHYVLVNGKRYMLCQNLGNDKTRLFPLEHLHYEPYHPLINDGPDVVEIVEAMGRTRRAINDALLKCTNATERARIMEDERRFAYGEATVEFYYRLIRTALFYRKGDVEQARREFALVERQAEILKEIVDLVQVSSLHTNAKNGLEATQALAAYRHFQKLLNAGR